MATFAVYNATQNEDLSSYITSCGDVAVCERNRDFTLVASSFTLTESTGIDLVDVGDIIEVSLSGSSYPFFIGYATRKVYNYESQRYDIDVVHIINKLVGEAVTAANIASLLTSANLDEYNPSDDESLPNVQMFYLIKTIFEHFTGYDLIVSTLLETVSEIKTPIEGAGEKTFKFKHICMDLNMVYASFTDCFDLFSQFCSSLKLGMNLSQTSTARRFYLYIHSDTGYSFDDDYIYQKKTESLSGKNGGYKISVSFDGVRSNYDGKNPPNSIEQSVLISEDGTNEVSHTPNFIMPYRDLRQDDGTGYIYPIVSSELTSGTAANGVKYIVTNGQVADYEVGTIFTGTGSESFDATNRGRTSDFFLQTCYGMVDLTKDYQQMNGKTEAEVSDFTTTEITYKHIIDNTVNMVYNRINIQKHYSECYQEVIV